jgi:type II secretory pathway predicted ATPase ExeA
MYEAFYGMTTRPFALKPDPAFLFMSRKHRFAFSMIEYALSGQAGFTVITGDIGSGKTTLIRHLLKRSYKNINYGIIANTHESFGNLLQWILTAFGIQSETNDLAARYEAFVSYLIAQYAAGKQTILIVDEAQNLSIELLEELRLLSNINADEDQLLQMILVGQPELLEKLRRPELVQFAQRISVSYHLTPLSYFETKGYIKHRLTVAQADPELFSESAIKAVFHFTKGVPRLINSVCDMACVYGYADGLSTLDTDIVLAVIQDKKQSGLLPLYNLGGRPDRQEIEAAIEESVAASCSEDGSYDFGPHPAADQSHHSGEPGGRVSSARKDQAANGSGNPLHDLGAYVPPAQLGSPSSNVIVPITSQRRRQAGRSGNLKWLFPFT